MKNIRKIASSLLMVVILLACSGCATKIAVPEVEEAQFEVSVTYIVDGEVKTFSGVYVCKYAGAYITLASSGRMWESYLKNYDDTAFLVKKTGDEEVYIDFGWYAEYLMSDPECDGNEPEPAVYVKYIDDETGYDNYLGVGYEDEIFLNYGVKILGYFYSDPIENNYSEKLTFGHFEPSIN